MDEFDFERTSNFNIHEKWDWKKDCYFCMCLFCGNVYICSDIMRCPDCGGGNIKAVPFRNDSRMSFRWLNNNGFCYCEELVQVVK